MMFFEMCAVDSVDISDMCQIDALNIVSTTVASVLLAFGCIYIHFRHKERCRTLFYLHNVRSMVHLLLLFTILLEVAESYLAVNITPDENISISPLQITYAWMSLVSATLLTAFIRCSECRDKAEYLYLSLLCQILVFVTKIYKVVLLTEILDLTDMRPVLIECTIACLMVSVLLDSYTIYIESKTPSLWLCYAKTHWKMFLYGGFLKLCGDLTALIGPISITQIVEYIDTQINLNASSSLLTSVAAVPSPARYINDDGKNVNAFAFRDNDTTKIGSNNNYHLPSAHRLSALNRAESDAATLLINENTEIYYPTWSEFAANGWIMALLVLFASLAQGTLSQASTHIVNVIGIRLRTSLQGLVYRKTLLISSSCFAESACLTDSNSSTTSLPNNNNNSGSNDSTSADTHEMYNNNRFTNNECTMNEIDDHNDNDDGGDGGGGDAEIDKIKTDSSDTPPQQQQQQQEQQQQQSHHQPSAKQQPNEQTVIDTGTITNLMSEDALNVMSFFWIAHYVWAIPLKISFVMYLLYQMLGVSAVIGSTVCIVTMIPLQFFIGKKMSHNVKIMASLGTEIQMELSHELIVSIRNAVFSWRQRQRNGADNESRLRIDRLDIPRGKLTVIVGRSGSGKTSLLAAILKEMRCVSGEVIWNKLSQWKIMVSEPKERIV